jgi:transposase
MMLGTRAVRVWARTRPTDLRKGYAGLAGLVMSEMGRDLSSGDLFLFVSKQRTSAKILQWDGSGLCLYSKRLAEGRFAAVWQQAGSGEVRLTMGELALFLEGAKREGLAG